MLLKQQLQINTKSTTKLKQHSYGNELRQPNFCILKDIKLKRKRYGLKNMGGILKAEQTGATSAN